MKSNSDRSTYLVLGGTGAIGQAICRSLAAAGHAVHFSYGRNLPTASALADGIAAAGGQATFQRVLWDEEHAFDALADTLRGMGPLGGAVYASGPEIEQPFLSQIAPERWTEVFHQDVVTFLKLAHTVVPLMRAAKGGSLLAITTVATQRHAARNALGSVPKAAIEAAVRGLAREEGRFGIRANCVAPGMLDAGMGERMMQAHFSPEAVARLRQSIPLQSFGTAEDIAAAAVFLLSPAARYITGQTLCVDGGWTV